MKAIDLSKYKRERFSKNRACAICGRLISDTEEMCYTVHKYGHWRKYFFMHRGCFNGEAKGSDHKVEGLVP